MVPLGVRLGVGLGPRRLQAPNAQQGRSLPEGLSGGRKGGCRSGSYFGCQGHTRPWALVEEASGILQGSCSRAWKPHAELPASMPSESAPLLDPRRVVVSDVGIGTPWGERLR